MVIGRNKDKVVENIIKATKEKKFNSKVEVDDPNLTTEQKNDIVYSYLRKLHTLPYIVCNFIAHIIISVATMIFNKDTVIVGVENIKGLKSGAIVTSNHFNPLDNLVVRKAVNKSRHGKLFIVSQETNLAMNGFVGFFMKHADIIPITNNKEYLNGRFPQIIKDKLNKNKRVLIYPEQEMWYNYRKPRPPKRGTYYYAAQFEVPIISCFVEILDKPEKESEDFYKTKYVIHILETIYPDITKSPRENSIMMMEKDFKQKSMAYEKAYGKKLDYSFDYSDIAGYIPQE